jgi:mannosyltransferase
MTNSREALKASGSRAWHRVALVAVILTAFALRIWLLGAQNIWWDEGLAIWAVRKGWADMTLWTASDVHPPVYFWLLKAWVAMAGESEFAARFISLICGTLTVAAVYPLGKLLLGRKVALAGMALLAFSRFHIWWSQEMRMYVVATMWGVLSLYTLLRWLRAQDWIGADRARSKHPALEGLLYILTTVAGLYSLYLFAAVLLIENLFFLSLLVRQPRNMRGRSLGRWILVQAAVLLLLVPWLALALPRMRSWSVAEGFDFWLFLQLYATLLPLGISTYIERYVWLTVPFLALVGVVLSRAWRHKLSQGECGEPVLEAGRVAFLLALFLIIPPVIVYALTRPRGLFYAPNVEARYLVLFAPAFYLLLGCGVVLLYQRARWMGLAVSAFGAAVFIWTLPGHYAGRYLRDEHQTMVRVIAAYAQPGDAVLLVSGNRYPIFEYYYGRLPDGPVRPPIYGLPQHALQMRADNVDQELALLAAAHPRLWLAQVDASMQDPDGLAAEWLDHRYTRALDMTFGHNALTLFAPAGREARLDPDNIPPQHGLTAVLGTGGTLLGYDLATSQFRPGDTAHLALYYSAKEQIEVVVRMVNEDGHVLEQRQEALLPVDPVGRHEMAFAIYQYTPAGRYHFEIEPLDVADEPVVFGNLRIAGTQALPKAGPPPASLSAILQDGVELLGYGLLDASGKPVSVIHAGETITLDLYWRARRKVSRDYTVFTHLVGESFNPVTAGPVWAGHDSQPLAGGYPTTQWFTNEVIIDRHLLTLDGHAPSGEYELEVGMYLLDTMKRLPVLDAQGQVAGERVVLGLIRVQEH